MVSSVQAPPVHDRPPSGALLQDSFLHWAADEPERVALIVGDDRLTYGELLRGATAVADGLRAAGVARGHRVALFLDNDAHFVAGMLGTLLAGGVFMPINPTTKAAKLGYMLHDARASVLMTHASLLEVARAAIHEAPSVTRLVVAGGDPATSHHDLIEAWPEPSPGAIAATSPSPPIIDADLACLIYTSGSTGNPKGVMLTHLNMVSAARSVGSYLDLRGDDVILCALPLSFDYGLYQLLLAFRVGGRVVLERGFSFPVRILSRMERERVSVFPAVPTMLSMLVDQEGLGRFDLSSLRSITNTAAALSETLIARVRAAFPQALLYSMYGLTECKRVSYLPPEQLDIRPTSVGRGMPNEEVWLVDESGIRLPNGSTGELVIRGSHVMAGYWEKPEETAERLRPGPIGHERVLYSGDIFRTDDEGWLYFVARRDDIIKSRGEKVSPREVENVIMSLAGVFEVAVVGVPDDLLGQAIKAYVALQPDARLEERDVIRHCRAHLEPFMVPSAVVFVDEIPKTATGKIAKRGLE
jgi:amino acid adenylation domain-containing protein